MNFAKLSNSTIIREYDIRGIVGENLSFDYARAIGNAYGTIVAKKHLAQPRICVGYDGRLTSPDLEDALVEGLRMAGCHVIRIGLGPTPMLYFSVHNLNSDGGVMVTGSHNPPEYNGFKFMLGYQPFYGRQLQELGSFAQSGLTLVTGGKIQRINIFDNYVSELTSAFQGAGRCNVAWDPGNGAAGEVVTALSNNLPGDQIVINGKIDGTFPCHHPDPTVAENLIQLQNIVASGNYQVGIGLDGDGDRIGVVDDDGKIIWADILMALLVRGVLAENPGATIIGDVKCSQTLFDQITRLGGRPIMWRTGHSLIKSKMAQEKSPFAGEMSGHLFFSDSYYGFDDATYGAIRLLNLIEQEGLKLSELRQQIPELSNTPELRFFCADEVKFDIVEEVRDRLLSRGEDINDIDGVRVNYPDGWWLLRASNTQPVLVARCEARDTISLNRLKNTLKKELAESGLQLPE